VDTEGRNIMVITNISAISCAKITSTNKWIYKRQTRL